MYVCMFTQIHAYIGRYTGPSQAAKGFKCPPPPPISLALARCAVF